MASGWSHVERAHYLLLATCSDAIHQPECLWSAIQFMCLHH